MPVTVRSLEPVRTLVSAHRQESERKPAGLRMRAPEPEQDRVPVREQVLP